MRVLLAGATGLIGAAVAAKLLEAGHEVVAVARRRSLAAARGASFVQLDISRATSANDWLPHLSGVDAVVNCAGVLQDAPGESTAGVHEKGVGALFEACQGAGVRRVIHFSAIGVERESPSDFSRTKIAGDERLMGMDLDWIILRPSVVVGRQAYGASALFRGLAALPVLPVQPRTGLLQIVQLDEVVQTVLFFLQPNASSRLVLEIAGPDRLSFSEVVAAYRRWFGWREARAVRLPAWLSSLTYWMGDIAGWLGWRPPIRSTAQREIVRGAVGDQAEWTRQTGIFPRQLDSAFLSEPASVQERWFARLYLLKPMTYVVLSLFWVATGIVSLGPGWRVGVNLMEQGGAGILSAPSVVAGALADIAVGLGIALRRTAKFALCAGIGISLFYAVAGTLLLPILWADPLGPLLKIWPITVLHLVALAILPDR